MPYFGTILQGSSFCLGFLVTRFWPNLICLEKQGKMGKQKNLRKEKNMRCNKKKYVLIKLKMHSTELPNGVRIPRLLGFFVLFCFFVFLQYNWLQLDKTKNKLKINYKEITKKRKKENTVQARISLLSQMEQSKKSREEVDARGKTEYIFKAKERNNIKTMVLKIYL